MAKYLGVTGVGIGFSVAQFITFFGYSFYLKYHEEFKGYNLFIRLTPINKEYVANTFELGIPLIIAEGAELLGIMMNSAIIGKISGDAGLSAHEIVLQYLVVILVPIASFGQACSIMISKSFAENKIYNANKLTNSFLILGTGGSVSIFLTLAFIPRIASSIFMTNNNPNYENIISSVRTLFFITSVTQGFDAIRLISISALQGGYNDTKFSMLVDITCLELIGIPLGYILGNYARLGVSGVYIGRATGIFLSSMILLNRWKSSIAIDLEEELTKGTEFKQQQSKLDNELYFQYRKETNNSDFFEPNQSNQRINKNNKLCQCNIM